MGRASISTVRTMLHAAGFATHDSARSTEHSGGKVDSELRLDDTRVSVWSRNSAGRGQRVASDMQARKGDSPPDNSNPRSVDLPLGLVDVGDSLYHYQYGCP